MARNTYVLIHQNSQAQAYETHPFVTKKAALEALKRDVELWNTTTGLGAQVAQKIRGESAYVCMWKGMFSHTLRVVEVSE